MKHLFLSLAWLALGACALMAAEAPLLKDDFSDPKLAARKAARGPWKFAEGAATCAQDDELYKKNRDHGPIIFYDLAYQDAKISFSYKAAGVKSLVFTANGADGHIFRFVTSAAGTGVRAFPADSKDHKSIALANERAVKLKEGEWVPVVVELRGGNATVKIGADFTQTYEHASLARAKTNLSVGFSFGTLAVKDVVVEK